jgi:hypothetical protein
LGMAKSRVRQHPHELYSNAKRRGRELSAETGKRNANSVQFSENRMESRDLTILVTNEMTS